MPRHITSDSRKSYGKATQYNHMGLRPLKKRRCNSTRMTLADHRRSMFPGLPRRRRRAVLSSETNAEKRFKHRGKIGSHHVKVVDGNGNRGHHSRRDRGRGKTRKLKWLKSCQDLFRNRLSDDEDEWDPEEIEESDTSNLWASNKFSIKRGKNVSSCVYKEPYPVWSRLGDLSAELGEVPDLTGVRKDHAALPQISLIASIVRRYVPRFVWRLKAANAELLDRGSRLHHCNLNLKAESVAWYPMLSPKPPAVGSNLEMEPPSYELPDGRLVDFVPMYFRSEWWLMLRDDERDRVTMLGKIPTKIDGEQFASEISGCTYDHRRNLLWLFSLRRMVALSVPKSGEPKKEESDDGEFEVTPIEIMCNVPHSYDRMSMEYETKRDVLVGHFRGQSVEMRLR